MQKTLTALSLAQLHPATTEVTVVTATGTVFDTDVEDLQSDVEADSRTLRGSLKYYDDAESALVTSFGAGHFIALSFELPEGKTYSDVLVKLDPSQSGTGYQALDEDLTCVFQITDKHNQKIYVKVGDVEDVYRLNALNLLPEA